MSVLSSFSEEVRIASPLLSSVTPLPLSEKRSGTKLVKYLAKYQRFSIGSLRKTADWPYYFADFLSSIININKIVSRKLVQYYVNFLSILYKQNYSVFRLIDKTVR